MTGFGLKMSGLTRHTCTLNSTLKSFLLIHSDGYGIAYSYFTQNICLAFAFALRAAVILTFAREFIIVTVMFPQVSMFSKTDQQHVMLRNSECPRNAFQYFHFCIRQFNTTQSDRQRETVVVVTSCNVTLLKECANDVHTISVLICSDDSSMDLDRLVRQMTTNIGSHYICS